MSSGGLRVGRVPAVQHELVAVGIFEDRHVADTRVERLAEELEPLASSTARISATSSQRSGHGLPF